MNALRLAVLISGNGSNLQAIIDAIENQTLKNTSIVLVVSNRSKAFGIERAKKSSIQTVIHAFKPYKEANKTRADYDKDLADIVDNYRPDLVVLAGFMHILSDAFIDRFERKIINLHPALPGQFDGSHAIERAFQAFKTGKITQTGAMVHYVIPEVDKGPVIVEQRVPIDSDETLETLEEKIHAVEHKILVKAISIVLNLDLQ